MDIIQAVVLGVVQGATEFIPISSSAHLVLVPRVLGWQNPGLAFDAVLHLGTLLAVLAVFWRDLVSLAAAWLQSMATRKANGPQARLAWWIVLGTIPAALMGLLWEEQFEALFHSPLHVSVLLLLTGLYRPFWTRTSSSSRDALVAIVADRIGTGVCHCSGHFAFWSDDRIRAVAGDGTR